MTFVDANVFLDSLAGGKAGDAARACLRRLDEKNPASTSPLVLDEVFWILRKRIGRQDALDANRRLLNVTGLDVVPVTREHWASALDLMEIHLGLKPRDALHAAAALDSEPSVMISTDSDFDVIDGLRRIPP